MHYATEYLRARFWRADRSSVVTFRYMLVGSLRRETLKALGFTQNFSAALTIARGAAARGALALDVAQ
jgi:hypothetical protein